MLAQAVSEGPRRIRPLELEGVDLACAVPLLKRQLPYSRECWRTATILACLNQAPRNCGVDAGCESFVSWPNGFENVQINVDTRSHQESCSEDEDEDKDEADSIEDTGRSRLDCKLTASEQRCYAVPDAGICTKCGDEAQDTSAHDSITAPTSSTPLITPALQQERRGRPQVCKAASNPVQYLGACLLFSSHCSYVLDTIIIIVSIKSLVLFSLF